MHGVPQARFRAPGDPVSMVPRGALHELHVPAPMLEGVLPAIVAEGVRDETMNPFLRFRCRACAGLFECTAAPRHCPACGFGLLDQEDRVTARPMNAPQAEANKDAALAEVEAAADPVWKAKAREAVRIVAGQQAELTTDDVWKYLPPTRENRALGAIFVAAQKEGLIAWTDRTLRSERPDCNRRPLRVWKSLVFRAS